MSFKTLLEKYKSGTVTPDEKLLVEAELEKNEAINEYLSDQLMDALPSADSVERAFDSKAEAKKIRKRINRKFILTVLVSVAIVTALTCVTLFAVFPAINNMYYNPLKGSDENHNIFGGQLAKNMAVFSELRLSGYEIPFALVKPEGFGVYDVTFYQYDSFRNFAETPIHTKIVRGKFEPSIWESPFIDGIGINWVQSAYGNYTDTEKINVIHPAAIEELNRLPESAQVKAYLFFEESIDMQRLIDFRKETTARILWAGIKSSDTEKFWDVRFGFSPVGKRLILSTWPQNGNNSMEEIEYPLLELDPSQPSGGVDTVDETQLTAETYETHFLNMLKYINTRQEFLDLMGYDPDIEQALAYVEQNGVRCITVVVSGTRDEILALSENPLVEYIALDDVMVSEFSRR